MGNSSLPLVGEGQGGGFKHKPMAIQNMTQQG